HAGIDDLDVQVRPRRPQAGLQYGRCRLLLLDLDAFREGVAEQQDAERPGRLRIALSRVAQADLVEADPGQVLAGVLPALVAGDVEEAVDRVALQVGAAGVVARQ